MSTAEPFALFDCSLSRRATGRACLNLRELLDALRTVIVFGIYSVMRINASEWDKAAVSSFESIFCLPGNYEIISP